MQNLKPCTIALLALIAQSKDVVSATNATNAKCNRAKLDGI
ncbi:MAG: hypothetical protein WD361_14945 [Gracilimonas sp.]